MLLTIFLPGIAIVLRPEIKMINKLSAQSQKKLNHPFFKT
jgi:hypothetical protein